MISGPSTLRGIPACALAAASLVIGMPVAGGATAWAVDDLPSPAASQTPTAPDDTSSAAPVQMDPPMASPGPTQVEPGTPSPSAEPGTAVSPETGESGGAQLMLVGTVVNQGVVLDPTVTLTDLATGRELGSASTNAAGDFRVSLPADAFADVDSIGVTVSGTTHSGTQVSASAVEAAGEDPITAQRATQDSLLVMVDTPQVPGGTPDASVVLGSEASVLETAHVPAENSEAQPGELNAGTQTRQPSAEARSRLQLTGAGAGPAVIVGSGLVAVVTLGAAMVVAGRRRRS
ncbi:hypothetical protein [Kocuria sp. ZOR0020]|uniref:hypothetical protein n=1 Tax=Kocuria sp. ZOR0020 TaxID=1339234 RepID=UPI000646797F|nr:hypothetical protein [Kocuria sp. ZOR0020]